MSRVMQPLRGTRRMEPWGERRPRAQGKHRRVGICRICGLPIRWGESYHASGTGPVHLRCEWKGR